MANQPKILYHGSKQPNISKFFPQPGRGVSENAGQNVYATDNRKEALCHCLTVYGKWERLEIDGKLHFISTVPKEELENSPPGYLYHLPTETFTKYQGEYRSSDPVVPLNCEVLENPLKSIIDSGIIPVFMTLEEYDSYLSIKDKNPNRWKKFIQSKLQS